MGMVDNKIFVSTACLPWEESVEARVFQYTSNNITNIELGTNVTVETDLELLSNYQAHFLIHNYFPPPPNSFVLNLASKEEIIRNRSIEHVLNALDLSAAIKAPFYSVHAGFITDPSSFGETSFIFPSPDSLTAINESWSYFFSALDIVLEHAQKVGVNLLLENNVCTPDLIDKVILAKPEEFHTLFNELSHPNLGVLLDTGHLNVSAQTLGFNKKRFIDEISTTIQAIHIHDNAGIADTHEEVVEGSWVMDVLAFPNLLNATKIVESRFNNIKDLREYTSWMNIKIN